MLVQIAMFDIYLLLLYIPQLKKMNRLLEFQFHDAEFLLCAKALLFGMTTEVTEASSLLKKLWPKMLLNQFHDVLPGSSIEMV